MTATPEPTIGCACGHICEHGPHEQDLDHEPETSPADPVAPDEEWHESICGRTFEDWDTMIDHQDNCEDCGDE